MVGAAPGPATPPDDGAGQDATVVVARVGRPQGVRGEVTVHVRTDVPERRFVPGAVLGTDPDVGTLVLAGARLQGRTTVLRLEGVEDREAAEGLRGVLLTAPASLASSSEGSVDGEHDPAETDDWALEDLVGLRCELADGTPAGTLVGLDPSPAHDLLVVEQPSGTRALVPFVRALVPVVDVAGGRVVLTPPGGLLEVAPPVGQAPADPEG